MAAPVMSSAAVAPFPSAGSTGSLAEAEMAHIFRILEKHNGNKPKAAEELGISLKTLYNKLNKYEEDRQAAAG
jgi:DNA-binding NtrC family response regulator